MSTCPAVNGIDDDDDVDPFEVIESPTMLQISIGIGAKFNPALAERLMAAVTDVLEGIGGELGELIEEHIADVYSLETLEDNTDSNEDVLPRWLH
jgi:hypothetical protein